MCEFVSGPIERVLHEWHGEPFIPDRESPMPNDSGVRLKGRVQSAAGAVSRQEGKDRVLASSSRRSSQGDFDPGAVKTGVRDAERLAPIHNLRNSSSSSTGHEGGVDPHVPKGFVPMHAVTEVAKSLSEGSRGPATASNSIGAKKFGDGGIAGSVAAGGVDNGSSNRGLGGNNLRLFGRHLHEHGVFKDVHGEVNSLRKLPDN